ncbi:MAG TPA: hypothetical protein VNM91_07425 [Dehalococcoidia bacterium]|nr:hypothetical protein [Dehalococcoidia bacterium]
MRPYELHGTRYYLLLLAYDASPERPREARVSHEMMYDAPQPGDRDVGAGRGGPIARAE